MAARQERRKSAERVAMQEQQGELPRLPVIDALQAHRPETVSVTQAERLYFCPGEEHPISRSIHIARLAAFYPKCAQCALRNDTGQLRQQTARHHEQARKRSRAERLFGRDGIRGVHRNQLTRKKASEIAAAFAGVLWEQSPLKGLQSGTQRPAAVPGVRGPARPTVAVGYDERPSSPDLFVGVVAGLRRMGCQVVELGLVTRPQLWFACQHLETAGAVHVTGCGHDPAVTGIDLVARDAIPVSQLDRSIGESSVDLVDRQIPWTLTSGRPSLERIELRLEQPIPRFTRHCGIQRSFRIRIPYEASLLKHFQKVRGLRLVVGTSSRLMRECWSGLLERSGAELSWIELPTRARRLEAGDVDVDRVGREVVAQKASAGIVLADDGQQLRVLDEFGELVTQEALTLLAATRAVQDHSERPIILSSQTRTFVMEWLRRAGGDVRTVGEQSLGAVSDAMRTHSAGFANVGDHRYWHLDSYPNCDATILLGRLLGVLDQAAEPLSRIAREFEHGLRTAAGRGVS